MRSLYIHIPFCRSRCKYCDFLSYVPSGDDVISGYVNALIREMSLYRGVKIDTIYIGGGTPSILTPKQFGFIVNALYTVFDVKPGAEFTIEANPESLDSEKVRTWKAFGVSRVSLGIQSLNDSVLEYWGRITRSEDSIRAVYILSSEQIRNVNIDLILGLQAVIGKTKGVELYKTDLARAAAFRPAHISVYMLYLQGKETSGTFGRRIRLFDDKTYEQLYYHTVDFLLSCGFDHYEISNFAKTGFASLHNMNYWKGGAYIGLGPGAVSTEKGRREKNTEDLGKYIEALKKGKRPVSDTEILGEREVLCERIMLSLRTSGGIPISELKRRINKKSNPAFDNYLNELQNLGYAETKSDRLRLTPAGFFRSNYIISSLLRFFDQ